MTEKKGFDWSSTQPQIEKAGPKFVSSNTMEVEEKQPWYIKASKVVSTIIFWVLSTLACFYMWKKIFEFLEW